MRWAIAVVCSDTITTLHPVQRHVFRRYRTSLVAAIDAAIYSLDSITRSPISELGFVPDNVGVLSILAEDPFVLDLKTSFEHRLSEFGDTVLIDNRK